MSTNQTSRERAYFLTKKIGLTLLLIVFGAFSVLNAQTRYELNTGWKCLPSKQTNKNGHIISQPSFNISAWKSAIVPGTVLTNQLANGEISDPFYGMNNEKIPDIYNVGRDYYTYWFVKDFKEIKPSEKEQVWITFRGINYSCEIYLNGYKVNKKSYEGMYLRKTFNISKLLLANGKNRLAVIVYPPNPVGNPNGGQGGDGKIAKNIMHQYVAGWDWIQPIRDRNTGIWDKVFIERTGAVNIKNPHIVTLVPGIRKVKGNQADALLKTSAEIQNASNQAITGVLRYTLEGITVSKEVTIQAKSTKEVNLPNLPLHNPKLWWPAGYGPQNLYNLPIEFVAQGKKTPSDTEHVTFGVREIQTEWNQITRSKQISVNGQKIFIKGGNWIISDAMLRFSDARYDAEVRYHRDMNLNLIRIWGGAIIERPEFYQACDKYGMLVLQDFWFSGDCNGRWEDPNKAEDQWTRRKYPDNHPLVLESAKDMIKMIRNHPSLAIWCGGNEITPPTDILIPLRDEILPQLDGTRWFIPYSNANEWSYNFLGGNGDGPYSIQPINSFWDKRTWPFNSEVGSVGIGDYESLDRFIPKRNQNAPTYNAHAKYKETVDSIWRYHKYSGYNKALTPYGKSRNIHDYTMRAQLANYDQYRALMEGFSSHMWEWYTGSIIWKTQNPWTAMRGQMYDYYLDPNACLFGLRKGSEPIHVMCSPESKDMMIVNNTFEPLADMMLVATHYDMEGNPKKLIQILAYIDATSVSKISSIKSKLNKLIAEKGGFFHLQLINAQKETISDNFYWFPDANGEYSGLKKIKQAKVIYSAKQITSGKIKLTITNPQENPIAFFNRVALIDKKTGKRILPAFYDDNYVSVLPGTTKTILVEYNAQLGQKIGATLLGWNVKKEKINIQ